MVIFVIKILSNSSTFDGSVFIKKRANLSIHYLQVVKILSTHKREVIEIAVYKKVCQTQFKQPKENHLL